MPTTTDIDAVVSAEGVVINGQLIDGKAPLHIYREYLRVPINSLDAGGRPPFGYSNNRIHIFSKVGIYLTEHHALHLIDSINFVFHPLVSLFPIECGYSGRLTLFGTRFHQKMTLRDLPSAFRRDLPGEYSMAGGR